MSSSSHDGQDAKTGSQIPFPIMLGSVIAAVGYAGMVASYYLAQQQLKDRLKIVQEQHEKFVELQSKLGENGTCQGVLDSVMAHSDDEASGGAIPVLSILIMFVGCVLLGVFFFQEYNVAMKKKSANKNIVFTLGELVGYRLDYHFSSTKMAKPLLLFAVTFVLILSSTIGFALVSGEEIGTAMWRSWTYVADPGTHADAEGIGMRVVAFSTTMGGMCVFALMIGIISDFIGEKVDDLKKGRSRVIESSHTLMLGWSDMSLAIIQQISLANESEGGGVVVVLAKDDKEKMEEELAAAMDSKESGLQLKGTEVIFRSGNTLAEHDLVKASVYTARAIIALSDGVDPDEADSRMVRQILSLRGMLSKSNQEDPAHVVCELRDVDNKHLVEMVGKGLVETVCAHDIIGRLMIQCARAAGLAHVLENLMGFDGDEFYLKEWPALAGLRFGDILTRFDDAVPIGVKHDGLVILNPADDQEIQDGDEILVLAEDDDSYEVNDGTRRLPPVGTLPVIAPKESKAEVLLFCGWRRDMADMIKDLDNSVPANSELWLFNSVDIKKRSELLLDKGNKEELDLVNLTIVHALGNHYSRRDLKVIQARSEETGNKIDKTKTLDEFDSILILAEAAGEDGDGPSDMEASDSRSLASLLLVQDLQSEKKLELPGYLDGTKKMCEPISEILDTRTRVLLAEVENIGYVLSNQIVSAAIAQIAECRDMNQVLGELLRAEGCEVHIEPITNYVDTTKGLALSFWDVLLLARQRKHDTPQGVISEVAVGYKPHDKPWGESEDTLLNPPDKHEKRIWHAKDFLIVIAP